ncbi:MAG: hypothetical protein QF903_06500 [Planctomycetota bacterium]|nr:hypothetical protein [Planctomycetota bacterium]MDP6762122.1 hypothetical protein [Planctomycetota bacterium]MDP6989111.1 hypothetical protein [Planctomycetota bacterium]
MSGPDPAARPAELSTAAVFKTWWPLASSWLLMGAELPAIGAAVARLPEPVAHLAAFGIVFAFALLVEAPIIMMLAASTALCRDRESTARLRGFNHRTALGLTAIHALLAFTPLYDWVVVWAVSPPADVVEPARLGLMIMTPWTWAIADRRFHQGILIRFGRARAVGLGTLVRVIATVAVLVLTSRLGLSGIAVAATGLTVGVCVEMVFARFAVASILRERLLPAAPDAVPLTTGRLLAFYVPLAITPFLNLVSQPLGTACVARMPDAVRCLAAWPVVIGLVFMSRCVGIAFNEVVVSHAGDPGARRALDRFAACLAAVTVGILALFPATPLARWWFEGVQGLEPDLAALAQGALWFAVLLPGLTVAHSLYQGLLVHAGRTRGVTESVLLFLAVFGAILYAGVVAERYNGLVVSMTAFTAGSAVQAVWLWWRARAVQPPLAAAPASS